MLVIIDYGMGNLGSIFNMLKKLKATPVISSKAEDIEKADKLILPGVGAFKNGMEKIHKMGLHSILTRKVHHEKVPILGICLGMQLFTSKSEEGSVNGLGWLKAETVKFQFNQANSALRIPHMGWNFLSVQNKCPIFDDMYQDSRFYFCHSYYVKSNDKTNVISKTHYGFDFCSSINKDNIYGVQFHPEKSHKFGMQLLKNFVEKL